MNTTVPEFWPAWAGALVFLLLHGLLASFELSLIKLRFSHFNPELIERLRERPSLARILDDPDSDIRVARFGLTLSVLGYGFFVLPLIFAVLDGLGTEAYPMPVWASAGLAFFLAVGLLYLMGELVPRGLGLSYPVLAVRISYPAVRVLRFLMNWFIVPLSRFNVFLLRVIGVREPRKLESLDLEAQIEMLGEDAPEISAVGHAILKNTLQMRELVVSDVMLPRNQVQFFDIYESMEENLKMARRTGHTRFPLCEGDLDRCLGLIHIKDLFRYPGDIKKIDLRRIRREIIRVDSEEPLEDALTKLLGHRMHMALVIDEFRGAEGVLTLERILEQLVGDIRDEFDADEEVLVHAGTDEGEALVSGLTPIHEVEELFNVEVTNEDVSTLGGLITSELGRIPEPGESVVIDGLEIEVTKVDDTRVIEAHLRRSTEAAED